MAASNVQIAAIFDEIADLLDIQGENPFRIRAYRNAARVVEGLQFDLAASVAAGTGLQSNARILALQAQAPAQAPAAKSK